MIPGLSEATIRGEASDSSYQRGLEYFRSRAVDRPVQRGNVIHAEVEGSDYEPYQVSITFDAGGIYAAACTCPYDYGGWCKHIVAGAQWPNEREAALPLIRTGGRELMLNGTIDVLLHEKLVDDAIAFVDRKGAYYGYDLLAQVVEAAIPVQPDWAIRQSLRQADQIIEPGKADIYHHAVEWLRRARDAWHASGRSGEWHAYLDQLRSSSHGRKYKLMGLLEGISP